MLLVADVRCHSLKISEGDAVNGEVGDRVWGVSAEDATQSITWSVTYGIASPLGVPKQVSPDSPRVSQWSNFSFVSAFCIE